MNAVWYLCYVAGVWLGFTLFFLLVQKPLFFFSNLPKDDTTLRRSCREVVAHGCKSDFITASYLSFIPLVLTLFGSIFPGRWFWITMTAYLGAASVALGLLTTADTNLYRFWGFKIDNSVLHYLRSLKGATASVSKAYILGWLVFWAVLSVVAFLFTAGITVPLIMLVGRGVTHTGNTLCIIGCPVMAAVLVLIIRGLKPLPNNPSIVYFSTKPFLNHAALNPGYSIIYSLQTRDVYKKGFDFMPSEESEEVCRRIFAPGKGNTRRILNTPNPNILLIIWESANASLSSLLGGEESVAENFDRLAPEGVLFTNCYASSFRTERAIPSILGAIPGQPSDSIIRHTRKLADLPGIPRALKNVGYETKAVHGGDLSIVHKNDYYMSSGCDTLVQQKDFSSELHKGKWGVHDGEVLDWVYDDVQRLQKEGKRWFTVVQTLSSHEPFEVPEELVGDSQVKNSFAYTDKHIGRLIDRLKDSPAWEDLLVVIVADHGVNKTQQEMTTLRHAHIPLLMLGGAVRKPAVIDDIVSQTDLAATLLAQLGIDHSEFEFSRNVLADSYRHHPMAYHSFANGVMVVDSDGHTVIDLVSDNVIEGTDSPKRQHEARAILQHLYEYLDSKG